jgi:hypothetical protein
MKYNVIHENYLFTTQLRLDVNQIRRSCYDMNEIIKNNFSNDEHYYTGIAAETTKLYGSYNILMYPYTGFYELFQEIKTTFLELANPSEPYYIQSWLNVYNKGDYIDWHYHYPEGMKVWHGFYCVSVGDNESSTLYRIPNLEEIEIKSVNNLLVIGKSDGDYHKSTEWANPNKPRITIAFDIVPKSKIDPEKNLNHWIPL